MSPHGNRSKHSPKAGREPRPAELKAAREAAGLTQDEAAALIYTSTRNWQNWEQGSDGRAMPASAFELFMLKAGQYTWLEPEGREDGQRRLRFDNGALIEVRNPGWTRE